MMDSNKPQDQIIEETDTGRSDENVPEAELRDEGGDTGGQPETVIEDAPAEPSDKELLEAEKEKFLRLAAEYDNFRKRSVKERETLYQSARADTVTKLLPVYDNLQRALETPCADEPFFKGIEMTMTQLMEILAGMGVQEISAEGEKFDPERHNAVSRASVPEAESGIITAELQKGFTINGKVIRHSVVQVNE